MKTAWRRVGVLVLLMLCGGLAIAELVEEQAAAPSQPAPAISTNMYFQLLARRCNNLAALAQLLENAQYMYLPLLPPVSNMSFTATGGLTPFNFTNLPTGFNLQFLIPELAHGVAVYPVTVAQDPVSRYTVFMNSQGDVLYQLPPPAGYDPVAWLLAWRPNLGSSLTAANTNAWLGQNDPARVQLAVSLIDLEAVVPYLEAAAQARQEAQQKSSLMTVAATA